MRTGAQILVDQLIAYGVDTAFGVPGESFLAVLDAMHERRGAIRFVACRQEGGACFMAEAWGKLSNAPGICFVTRGPGATNASIGVHTAMQDSTPLILFVGQVGLDDAGREAFQEIDLRAFFAPIAKWAAQIDRADRVAEFVQRAFAIATSGRPGPVVLALPDDMLTAPSEAQTVAPIRPAHPAPAPDDLARFAEMLSAAERPLAILGGPGWTQAAAASTRQFLEAWSVPAVTAFRAKDRLDNTHPLYAGDLGLGTDPALVRRVEEADLLIVLGARLDENTTGGYRRIGSPETRQRLVHIFPDPDELNRVTRADLPICAHVAAMAAALADLAPSAPLAWADWASEARDDYEAFIEPVTPPGRVNPSRLHRWLGERLPADAIVTNGAGNFAGWLHRFYQHRQLRTQLAPISGAMGYDAPAAVAASLKHPGRIVVAHAGDGSFLMNGQELATAIQYGATPVIVVWDNGSYGTIRMHQERDYPGRVSGTDLRNPDFVAYARAFGAEGFLVENDADFPAAFEAALKAGRAALIHVRMDVEAISPSTTISKLRAAARGE